MDGWFSINLGDGMLASEPLARIEELFASEYAKVGSPKDMAVFIRHESEGRLHCELMAYFSPAGWRGRSGSMPTRVRDHPWTD